MKFIENMFPEQKPLFALIAEKYGYGEILDQMLHKSFNQGEVIKDLVVVQALLLVASTRCSSEYCYVFHSLILNSIDVPPEDIEFLTNHRKFPKSLSQFKKYDSLLSYAYFRKNIYVNNDYTYIADESMAVDSKVKRDLLAILIVSDFLLMLTVAFEKEINLEIETLFDTFPSHKHIPDYVKYFTKHKEGIIKGAAPVFTICTYCKSIKNQKTSQWEPVEQMISVLPKDAQFSHSACESCQEIVMTSIDA